jgi:hypothetical protein
MVSRALYPYSSLVIAREGDGDIIVDEGEWDTLLNIQNGFLAITRTGAADVWLPSWSSEFEGLNVYVGHDCDDKGLIADRKVAKSVFPFAKMVRKLKLPFQHREKHGEDWTDFWGQYSAQDMDRLFESAVAMKEKKHVNGAVAVEGPPIISVLESFDSKRVGNPVKLLVTIKGKKEPGYTVPAEATLSCDQAARRRYRSSLMIR